MRASSVSLASGNVGHVSSLDGSISISTVAEGLTNGAVARRPYMSPHTVNTISGTCSPCWALRTGSRSPPWYIARSSDVSAACRKDTLAFDTSFAEVAR